MKTNMIIGTRQSLLALWQSNHIAARLREAYPNCNIELKKIVTKGDRILDVPLAQIGDKGLFTKELEDALLNGEIDLAVHSLKDMPTTLPQGLCLTAITKRAHAYDAFVSNKYSSIEALPKGAIIGTSSLRRKAQLLAQRPDFNIVDLRGNVDTRLRKLDEGNMDAIILAAAGLERLGYHERIKAVLPGSFCLPAVGQGALAIECAEANFETRQMLAFLNDENTKQATDAERAFLAFLEGGCQVPIGVHAIVNDDIITVEAIIATLDGSKVLRDKINGNSQEAIVLGEKLAKIMLENGGREILATIK